jgi:AraC-like DNA-binding protein
MDVLSDVLRVVRLTGAVFFTAEFSAPWALDSPNPNLLASVVMPEAESLVLFHILTEGECIVECAGLPPVRMQAGDVVIFPHGERHMMRSHAGASPIPIGSVFSQGSPDGLLQVAFGGGGQKSRFICGYLNCDQKFNPMAKSLPTMLVVRSREEYVVEAVDKDGVRPAHVTGGSRTWLGTTLKFTISEAKMARPGNNAMLGRLTELMFVEILRQYMQQLPEGQGGWLAGLKDAFVGKALRLIHANPERNWTVGELAREAATSRSVLAQRFTELVGESPMRYLAAWRIQVAKQMLRDGARGIGEVSARVGYESEAAFNRAFKRATGSPPASWRKKAIATVASVAPILMPAKSWLLNVLAS